MRVELDRAHGAGQQEQRRGGERTEDAQVTRMGVYQA
jgi:hypothetical protein